MKCWGERCGVVQEGWMQGGAGGMDAASRLRWL